MCTTTTVGDTGKGVRCVCRSDSRKAQKFLFWDGTRIHAAFELMFAKRVCKVFKDSLSCEVVVFVQGVFGYSGEWTVRLWWR